MTNLPGKKTVVACLGESLTKGEISYNWVADLQARPENASVRFVNLGVGGDHSYNALKRLPQVIECRPDKVVVLIGAGDAVSTLSPARDRVFRIWKRLPRKHSAEWFAENMRRIAARLKSETAARIALCSLPLIGEDPDSETNQRIAEFSEIVRRTAAEERVEYLPFFERMHDQVAAAPGRAFDSNFLADVVSQSRGAVDILLRHESLDAVGEKYGWRFHVDGLHLNGRSGRILADLVQEFVSA